MQHVNSIPPPSGVAEAESCVERLVECLQATAEASFAEVGAAPVSRWVLSRAGSEHSRRFVSSSSPLLAAAANTLAHVQEVQQAGALPSHDEDRSAGLQVPVQSLLRVMKRNKVAIVQIFILFYKIYDHRQIKINTRLFYVQA